MIISRLANGTGRVRDLLRASEHQPLDISSDSWSSTAVVLRGLVFENILLKDTAIGPTFVECEFHGCEFSHVRSDGRFMGASNLWVDCKFSDVALNSVISPQNRFEACRFVNVVLRRYRPCETAFVRCDFERLVLGGLRVPPNSRNRTIRDKIESLWAFPEIRGMDDLRVSLLFEECRFESGHFRECRFRHASFVRSVVNDPLVENCDFEGAGGDTRWWEEASPALDTDDAFREALLDEVMHRLGAGSWTFRKLKSCAQRHPGRAFRLNWPSEVIEGGIPDEEYEALEAIVDSLRGRFP